LVVFEKVHQSAWQSPPPVINIRIFSGKPEAKMRALATKQHEAVEIGLLSDKGEEVP
jgi:hypothetical protein